MFYNNVFLFVGLTTLGTLSVQAFQLIILNYRRGNFVRIIIGDANTFIIHCLIPLDLCNPRIEETLN